LSKHKAEYQYDCRPRERFKRLAGESQ